MKDKSTIFDNVGGDIFCDSLSFKGVLKSYLEDQEEFLKIDV